MCKAFSTLFRFNHRCDAHCYRAILGKWIWLTLQFGWMTKMVWNLSIHYDWMDIYIPWYTCSQTWTFHAVNLPEVEKFKIIGFKCCIFEPDFLEIFQLPLKYLQLPEWQVCPEKALERHPKARCQPSNPQPAAGLGGQVGASFHFSSYSSAFSWIPVIVFEYLVGIQFFFKKKNPLIQPRMGEKKPRMGEKKPRMGGPQNSWNNEPF